MTTVNCPKCNTPVVWNETSKFRPFCSERCRLVDLGHGEEHRIADKTTTIDAENIDVEEIEALLEQQKDDFFKQ